MYTRKFRNYPGYFILTLILMSALGAMNDAFAEVIYYEVDGMIVGEGEIYTSRTAAGPGDTWLIVPDEDAGAGAITNARGGSYVQSLPDQAGGGGGPLNDPEITYKMQIYTPGTYRLYLRREGNVEHDNGGTSDSIFMDIVELKDGTSPAFGTAPNLIADWYEQTGNVDGDFATTPWSSTCQAEVNQAGAGGDDADWIIPEAGIYTLRITQREDGSAIDAWVFQLASLPPPTGYGPEISPLEPIKMSFNVVEDTYLTRNDGTNSLHGSENGLLVKNDGTLNTSGLDRISYLRFDLSTLAALGENVVITNAALDIYLVNEGSDVDHDIVVAVIDEDATAEQFDELTLSTSADPPSNNDVWNASTDEAVNFDKIYGGAPIGSFLISTNNEQSVISFKSDGLKNAIIDDTDGVLSLVLYREFNHSQIDTFASKEDSARPSPKIRINYFITDPGTIILIK